jgi:hypothetical protein
MSWEKKVSQIEAVKAFLVSEGGMVNLEASVAKFRETALMHIAKQEAEEVLVKMCLNEVFDHYKGSFLNQNALWSATIEKMKAKVPELGNPSLYGFLCKRIDTIMHEDLGEPGSGKTFMVKRGAGGGFGRAKDQTPTTPKG